MQLMIVLIGEYTDEEFLKTMDHLDVLRKQHPSDSIDVVTTPSERPFIRTTITEKFKEYGYAVAHVSVQDFVNHDINSLSNSVV